MSGSSASSSSCTVTYVGGSASLSCVNSTSSGYQVILLQDNDPYNLTVVNVTSGENQTVPVVASGRYCIMELSVGDEFSFEVKYSRDFTAEFEEIATKTTEESVTEETTTQPSSAPSYPVLPSIILTVMSLVAVTCVCSE